jgi:hypothetical protein
MLELSRAQPRREARAKPGLGVGGAGWRSGARGVGRAKGAGWVSEESERSERAGSGAAAPVGGAPPP